MIDTLSELVIDTNIFVHSDNPGVSYYQSSRAFLKAFMNSEVALVVDEHFDTKPAVNSSRIGYEYVQHIHHGSLGFYVLLLVIENDRLHQAETAQYTPYKRRFKQMVRNKTDIIFLSVAASTADKVFVSNDFNDFQRNKRIRWKRENLVSVFDSEELTSQQED